MRILNKNSKDCILDRVYAKLHRDASFEICISNDSPEVFSSYASRKSRSKKSLYECPDL